MKKLLYIFILCGFCAVSLRGQNTESQNQTVINVVRNNTLTPARVANALDVLNSSKMGFMSEVNALGTDTYTADANAAIVSYQNGLTLNVKFPNANTSGTVTLNVNSIGASPVKNNAGADVDVGEISAGGSYLLRHNGTEWRITGLPAGGGGVPQCPPPGLEITSNYTVTVTDVCNNMGIIESESGSDVTLTIPTNAAQPFAQWTQIGLINKGPGALIIDGSVGVQINLPPGVTQAVLDTMQFAVAVKVDVDEWAVSVSAEGGGASFILTDGNATTAGPNSVDLGGTQTDDVNINSDGNNFGISNVNDLLLIATNQASIAGWSGSINIGAGLAIGGGDGVLIESSGKSQLSAGSALVELNATDDNIIVTGDDVTTTAAGNFSVSSSTATIGADGQANIYGTVGGLTQGLNIGENVGPSNDIDGSSLEGEQVQLTTLDAQTKILLDEITGDITLDADDDIIISPDDDINLDPTGAVLLSGLAGTSGQVFTSQGTSPPIWTTPSGGGGITNGAANNEIPKSNGTNLVASGMFSTAAGNVTWGSVSLSGDRTETISSSTTNANKLLVLQGVAGYEDISTTGASGSVRITPASGLINVGQGLSRGTIAGSDAGSSGGDMMIDGGDGSTSDGNIGLFTRSTTINWQSAQKAAYVHNATVIPTAGTADGTFLYSFDVGGSSELFVKNEAGVETKLSGELSGSATLNFDLTALNFQDLTITVTGAAAGDIVSIGVPAGAVVNDVTYFGWVSATNTVSIRASRVGGGGAADPASGTFKVRITP